MEHCVVRIILAVGILTTITVGFETFDESAWTDKAEKDNFFDYREFRDITEEIKKEIKTFSNNVDFELFKLATDSTYPEKTSQDDHNGMFSRQSSPNPLNILLNTIRNVISTSHHTKHHHNSINETTKGIDLALDEYSSLLPAFDNSPNSKLIFPGTKYCGRGDSAKDLNDIGYFYLTDHCCREHDMCQEIIPANSERFGLVNSGKFTRLSCDCDQKFYKCLKRVNTLVSRQIGIFYFNVLGHQCFKQEHEVISCKSKVKGRCLSYKINKNSKREYQWFDNRWF